MDLVNLKSDFVVVFSSFLLKEIILFAFLKEKLF